MSCVCDIILLQEIEHALVVKVVVLLQSTDMQYKLLVGTSVDIRAVVVLEHSKYSRLSHTA